MRGYTDAVSSSIPRHRSNIRGGLADMQKSKYCLPVLPYSMGRLLYRTGGFWWFESPIVPYPSTPIPIVGLSYPNRRWSIVPSIRRSNYVHPVTDCSFPSYCTRMSAGSRRLPSNSSSLLHNLCISLLSASTLGDVEIDPPPFRSSPRESNRWSLPFVFSPNRIWTPTIRPTHPVDGNPGGWTPSNVHWKLIRISNRRLRLRLRMLERGELHPSRNRIIW